MKGDKHYVAVRYYSLKDEMLNNPFIDCNPKLWEIIFSSINTSNIQLLNVDIPLLYVLEAAVLA